MVGAVLGGLLSLAGALLSNVYVSKNEKAIWLRDQRVTLFCELIKELESINVPVIIDSLNKSNSESLNIDTDEIESRLYDLSNYISENIGKLIIFLPGGLYSELMKLREELYCATTEKTFATSEMEDSYLFAAVKHAKRIVGRLKRELVNSSKTRNDIHFKRKGNSSIT